MAKNELVSLALLKVSPMHAYAINSILEEMGVEHWAQVSRASLYATLNRLEKKGAISVRFEKVDNMPERKVYSITEMGEMQLKQELKDAISTVCKSDSNLFHLGVNLFFGVSPDDGIVWCKERISSLTAVLKHVLAEMSALQKIECLSAVLTLEAAKSHTDVELKATHDFMDLLTNKPDYFEEYSKLLKEGICEMDKENEKRCR